MSELRIRDQKITIEMPRIQGKIQHGLCPKKKIELFGAYQFRTKHNRMTRNFHPTVPILSEDKEAWYLNMFRLRIDGKWHPSGGKKYVFLSRAEISVLLLEA